MTSQGFLCNVYNINLTFDGRNCMSGLKTQSVPRSKHSVIKTSQFMLYREIIAVCSEIQAKQRKCIWE